MADWGISSIPHCTLKGIIPLKLWLARGVWEAHLQPVSEHQCGAICYIDKHHFPNLDLELKVNANQSGKQWCFTKFGTVAPANKISEW